MRVARYIDRLFLEISDVEYLAAHRRFSENRPERLRASISLAEESWISVQIEPPYSDSGNVFVRTKNGWSVTFGKTTRGLDKLPVFALSDVGKFDPDDTGLELIPLPSQLRKPIEKFMSAPPMGQMITVNPPSGTGPTALGATVVLSDEPAAPKKVTQEEYLAKLKRAAKILNSGLEKGFVPVTDKTGKIIKISMPDIEI